MRTRKKFLSLVMAFIMIMSILPATALAEEPEDDATAACTRTEGCTLADGHEGECVLPDEPENLITPAALEEGETVDGAFAEMTIDGTTAQYNDQQKFMRALQDSANKTIHIRLLADIEGLSGYIPIAQGQTVTLDMNGKSITTTSTFTGRPIVNEGTLTVTGNGTIDSSASENGGYGAINNKGTLTIENGTYRGAKYASGSAIRNTGADAVLTIEDGTFEEATCAVFNEGTVTIDGGTFSNESCSTCAAADGHSGEWSYAIRNATVDSRMVINGGTFTGTQGAVSAAIGYLEVNDGSFKTVDCEKKHGAIFYALYAAGEVGEVECVINGGIFETEGHNATVLIGNDNTNGDGGINAQATAYVNGGTFIAPEGVPALKGAEKTGDPVITGGSFTSDVSKYVDASCKTTTDADGKTVVAKLTETDEGVVAKVGSDCYKSLSAAIAAAKDGDKVTLLKDDTVGVANESDFWINKSITLDLNQHMLTGAYQIAVGVDNPNAKVTIKNGTLVGGTSYGFLIKAGEAVLDGITINDDAPQRLVQLGGGDNIKLTIKDSVIKSTRAGQYGIVNFGNKNKVIIENSEISADYWAVYHNGSYYGFEIEGTDSSLTSASAQAVYISGSTITTAANGGKNQQASFTGCTITGTSGIEGKYTDITLKDCNITATDKPSFTQSNNGSTASGCAVVSTDNSMKPESPAPNATIKIESGQYIGAIGLAQLIDKVEGNFEYFQEAKYIISGGDYSEPVNPAYLSEELKVELCSRARNAVAPYSYYESVSEAIAVAAETGDPDAEIRLLDDDIGETARCTVTFINDGSNVKMTVNKDTVITLPALTRSGYTFLYWSDGSKTYTQGSSYTVASDVTLTAYWSRNSSSGGSGSSGYTVSVDSGKNGSVTVSPKSASKGTTVTITVKPDKGYELEDLTVTDKNGDELKLTKKSDTKYTFTMPAGKVTVEATFVKVEETLEHSFTDVPNGYWAEDAIAWAYENGYMNGNTAVTFNPEGTVSRQQLWMILARLSGYNPAAMAEAKSWAVDNGISDGTAPGGAVSRQQLVTILYRYAVRMGYKTSGSADLTAYPDHASVAAYAKDAMSWSVANSIVGGTTQGTLNPAGTATRAQFAVILSRFCENIAG